MCDLDIILQKILEKAIESARCHEPCVLGHGDFQKKNICITPENNIVPLDWIDFGLVLRWYNIGNLLYGQKRDDFEELLMYYVDKTNFNVNLSRMQK